MKKHEYTTIIVKYAPYVPAPYFGWIPIVNYAEELGYIAIPKYKSKNTKDYLLEHEIVLDIPKEKIAGFIFTCKTVIQVAYPWIINIRIKDEG